MIRENQRWFLKQWLKHRGLTYEKFAEKLGASKGVISDLANGKERWNRDHLWEFAEILDCEPWEIINRDPLQPPPPDLASIYETVQRIPLDERERALRATQRMLEAFTPSEPTPEARMVARGAKKRRKRA